MSFSEPKLVLNQPNIFHAQASIFLHQLTKSKKIKSYLEQGRLAHQKTGYFESLDEKTFKQEGDVFVQLARRNKLLLKRSELISSVAWLAVLSQRQLNLKPYEIQLACALAMLDGFMVQLAPGEGKTLTLSLVASIFGWHKKPCHVITANDYLAERDAKLLEPLFVSQGLSVNAIKQDLDPADKRRIYQSDIVYGTAKQMLADYLSDVISFEGLASRQRVNLKKLQGDQQSFVMRGLYSVIVDEADSILIDDATTPLIISYPEPNPLLNEAVLKTREFVDQLFLKTDYILDEDDWEVKFTQKGYDKLEAFMPNLPGLWHNWQRLEDLVIQGVLAKDKFKLDEHFVILDDKVVLVDESTGRLMHGRSWSYGLQQAVEARAGLELTPPSKTLDKMSFQSFFQSYHRLTGASGTLQDIQQELFQTYRVHTLEMPTRKPSQLDVREFKFFSSSFEKNQFLVEKAQAVIASGRPLLIGTRNINDTEKLAEILEEHGFSFDVLNAKQLDKEAQIIERAGSPGKVTLATNMAGRGTDIKVDELVLERGGLCVIMYEPHEASRTDWQLFGRAGRHGNPGEAIPLVCSNDYLLERHLPFWIEPLVILINTFPAFSKLSGFIVNLAQQNAQSKAFNKRKFLLKLHGLSQERMSFVKSKTSLAKD